MLKIIEEEKVIPLCKNIAQEFSEKALLEVDKLDCPYGK